MATVRATFDFIIQCYSTFAEPEPVALVTSTQTDTHLNVKWSHSSHYSVVRYIVKVRQYVADGPGAVKIQTVPNYPQELSGTQLSHIVGNLSKALVFYENFTFCSHLASSRGSI